MPKHTRNLDKFSTNLIHKKIDNVFVTSEKCMCDLIASKITSMIQIYHGFNHKNKIRATTAPAGVVVPLALPLGVQICPSIQNHPYGTVAIWIPI